MLWSINTTPNWSTGYTPFFMVYGAEAVLPSDIRHDSPRVANYVEADNEQACQEALDLLDEKMGYGFGSIVGLSTRPAALSQLSG